MAITNYQIEMLNVGDADAFIVYYITDDGGRHLVLIDAGRYDNGGEKVLNHLNSNYKDIPVELAIVTHPDDDHYGGFVYMLEQVKLKATSAVSIHRFWLNDPRKHISVDDVEEVVQKKTLEKRLTDIYSVGRVNLLTLIDELHIPHEEAFASTYMHLEYNMWGNLVKVPICRTILPGYFTILGPSKSYFETQCQAFRYEHIHVQVEDEGNDAIDERNFSVRTDCLSQVLEDANDDQSNHNRSSIIVLFEPGDGNKFLFTGDASVDSFEDMDRPHQNKSRNVTWLKVPHHGSKHNLNTKWISHFHPNVAYISTLKRGQYLNQCVVNALKKIGCKVFSTHNNDGTYIVHGDILNRNLLNAVEC